MAMILVCLALPPEPRQAGSQLNNHGLLQKDWDDKKELKNAQETLVDAHYPHHLIVFHSHPWC